MEFITVGETINCVRVFNDPDTGEEKRLVVTSFNAQVDRVAPHVAAALTQDEREQLAHWLTDRTRLQSVLEEKSIETTILETLPALMAQAVDALDKLETLDRKTYESITQSLRALSCALERAESHTTSHSVELDQMQDDEELKERLDVIRDNLEKRK
ncbi:hypothetical protein [Amphritea pacifica]|uniref:Terminase small subunit n=1 Tax=Amphritea pacifica TaxID=2811233 RepID=A0ABS2W9X2_9GAMM|nr:hypothetical protein [Amphritea pacifica]MBN0988516.1 hypothetical protein [Amphritea pacifica]